MENLNKALSDLLLTLKEINRQTTEVLKAAEEIKEACEDEIMERLADDKLKHAER